MDKKRPFSFRKIHTGLRRSGTVFFFTFVTFLLVLGSSPGADAATGITAIAAGGTHTVALKGDGTVAAWGSNVYGQSTVPPGLTGVIAVAAGGTHTVALKGDGTVAAWGNNGNGQINVPPGLTGVIAVAAGRYHTVALKGDGTVTAWGSNVYGQSTVPSGLTGVIAIAAGGDHTAALKSDGTVTAWGSNAYGQINVPPGLTGVTAISAGWVHTVALKSDGTVTAWGYNGTGQTDVPPGLSGVTAISAGWYHTVALKSDGTVTAWGDNDFGQINVPSGLDEVSAVGAARYHTVALKSDGTVVAWGNDSYGQTTVPDVDSSGATAVAAGGNHTSALKSDGTVTAWGDSTYGQTTVPPGLASVSAVAAGGNHTVALKSDGTVTAWGDNTYGQTTVPNHAVTINPSGALSPGDTATITGNAGGIDCVWDGTTTSGTCISGDILSTTRVVLKSVYPAGITISWGPGCDIETSTTCTIISLDSDVIIEPVFLGPPPDPFTFDDQINVPLNTVINSNTITVSGLILPAVISITACSSPSCEYSVNNSGWTSLPGTVNNGDTVTVRQVSSGGNFTTTDLTLSVGGATDTFSVRTIPNYPPPVAQFLLWPDLTTSYEIHFDATSSTCTSTPCTYSWDFGDGSSGSGMTTSHTYADGTTVTVTLTVTDAYLLSAGASQSVVPTPVNLPPTVSSTAPSISNYTISLADTSSDAPGNNPSGFLPGAVTITWGDGAQSAGNASGTFTHTYAAASVYAIIHTIRNAVGLWASEKMKVRVPEKFSISVATTPALTGTSLYVKTSGGSTIKYCTTSLTGSCVFTNLLPNTYKIQAYKSRYAFDGDPVTPGNQNPVNVTVGPDRTVNFNHTP